MQKNKNRARNFTLDINYIKLESDECGVKAISDLKHVMMDFMGISQEHHHAYLMFMKTNVHQICANVVTSGWGNNKSAFRSNMSNKNAQKQLNEIHSLIFFLGICPFLR